MAAHPDELHLVRLHGRRQALPEIDILDRVLVGGTPIPPLPVVDPGGDAVAHIAAVGVQTDAAGSFQRLDGSDRPHQLHAVVGGGGLEARELALLSAIPEDGAPTARSRVPAAGAVRKDVDDILGALAHPSMP